DDSLAGPLVGGLGRGGDRRDADGAGVAGEDLICREELGELGEEVLLDFDVLDDRLDDDVGILEHLVVVNVADAGLGGLGILGLHAAFLDIAGQALLVVGPAAVDRLVGLVADEGLEAVHAGDQ